MKRLLFFSGLLIFLVGAFFWWRAAHPALTDEQQIAADIDGMTAAASSRSAKGVASFLAPDFRLGETKRLEFQRQLAGGFLQYQVVDLKTAGVTTSVQDDTATSSGNYTLSLKSEFNSPPQVHQGTFKLKWRKEDGAWVVIGGEGELPAFP